MYHASKSMFWKSTCIVVVDMEYWKTDNNTAWPIELAAIMYTNSNISFNVKIMPPVTCGTISNPFWNTVNTCNDTNAKWPTVAIVDFFNYLHYCMQSTNRTSVTLFAHGLLHGDLPVLRRTLQKFNIYCPPWIQWFDTLPFFQQCIPHAQIYTLKALSAYTKQNVNFNAHVALTDALQLKQILSHVEKTKGNDFFGFVYCPASVPCAEVISNTHALHQLCNAKVHTIADLVLFLRMHTAFTGENEHDLLLQHFKISKGNAQALVNRCRSWFVTNA